MSTNFPGTRTSSPHRAFDVIVIGAGSAGVLAATTAKREGARVAIIEEMVGNARDPRGINPSAPRGFGEQMMDQVAAERLVGISRIVGTPEFVSASAIRANGRVLEAGSFVIATGSVPRRPVLSGLPLDYTCTPEDVPLDASLPRRIAVLGAGPTGLELAQACARSGSSVTVLDTCAALLQQSPLCGEMLARAVGREVDIRLGIRICGVHTSPHGVTLRCATGSVISEIVVDRVVFALGRAPRVQHLALDRAGVEQFAGVTIVDRYRRTTNPHVWVAGDDTPDPDGLGDDDRASEIAGYNAAHPQDPKRCDSRSPVRIIATDPSYACVGETEPNARMRLGELYTAARRYSTDGIRARTRLPTRSDGLVRMWTDRSGRILGGEAIGAGADLLVHLLAHSIADGSTVESLRSLDFSPRSIAHALVAMSEALSDATIPPSPPPPAAAPCSGRTEPARTAGGTCRETAQTSLGRVSAVPPAASG